MTYYVSTKIIGLQATATIENDGSDYWIDSLELDAGIEVDLSEISNSDYTRILNEAENQHSSEAALNYADNNFKSSRGG